MSSNKLRESLKEIADICDGKDIGGLDRLVSIYNIAKHALAEPLRNCDVGSAVEQTERHDKYCERFISEGCGASTNDCIACFARWTQMPYEKGATK
jgi:hypothetical protein